MALKSPHKKLIHSKAPKMMSSTYNVNRLFSACFNDMIVQTCHVESQTTEKPRQMALKSPHKKIIHSKAPKMMSSTYNLNRLFSACFNDMIVQTCHAERQNERHPTITSSTCNRPHHVSTDGCLWVVRDVIFAAAFASLPLERGDEISDVSCLTTC